MTSSNHQNLKLLTNVSYQRDWRWHKELQQWMMKAKELGEPVPILGQKDDERGERGFYYFFDVNNWRRERVSIKNPHFGNACLC